MNKFEFGSYLKKIREDRNLSTRQVETYTKVSNSYLSLIENGKRDIPSPDILRKLSPLYKVPYEELMFNAGYLEPNAKLKDFNGNIIVDRININNPDIERLIAIAQDMGIEIIDILEDAKNSGLTTNNLKAVIDATKKLKGTKK